MLLTHACTTGNPAAAAEGDATEWASGGYAAAAGVHPQPSASGEYTITFQMKGVTYSAPVKRWESTVAETAASLSPADQARHSLVRARHGPARLVALLLCHAPAFSHKPTDDPSLPRC